MSKTRIRMLTRATHPEIGVLHPGRDYTIDAAQASDFIKGGYAERVAADAPAAPAAPSSPLSDSTPHARDPQRGKDEGDSDDAGKGKPKKKGRK